MGRQALAASFTIAARHNQLDREAKVVRPPAGGAELPRGDERIRRMATRPTSGIRRHQRERLRGVRGSQTHREAREENDRKAKTKDSRQALDRLTEEVDGQYRIKSEPPLLVPLRELSPGAAGTA